MPRTETWVLQTGRGEPVPDERLYATSAPDVYTPMGQVAQWGSFASGVRDATGWKRWVGYGFVFVFVLLIILTVLFG